MAYILNENPAKGEIHGKMHVLAGVKRNARGLMLWQCECTECGIILWKNKHNIIFDSNSCKNCYELARGYPIFEGEVYGSLYVTGKTKYKYNDQIRYELICGCGKVSWRPRNKVYLSKYCSKDCPIERALIDPKPGAVYGNWVVLGDHDVRSTNNKTFMCQCVCGTKRAHTLNTLRKGHTNYCEGCPVKAKRLELVPGQKFWSYTVIEGIKRIGSSKQFRIKCNCGVESWGSKSELVRGLRRQCQKCYRESVAARRDKKVKKFIPFSHTIKG